MKCKYYIVKSQFPTSVNMERGWGNGYAVLPKGHPCHGMHHDAIHDNYEIEAHGGLTYSGLTKDLPGTVKLQLDGIKVTNCWIVGFDTAHTWDTPKRWPKEAVKAHAKELAQQFERILIQSLKA